MQRVSSRSPRRLLEPDSYSARLASQDSLAAWADDTLQAPRVEDTLVTCTPPHLRFTESKEALWMPGIVPDHLAYTQSDSGQTQADHGTAHSHGSIPVNCSPPSSEEEDDEDELVQQTVPGIPGITAIDSEASLPSSDKMVEALSRHQ